MILFAWPYGILLCLFLLKNMAKFKKITSDCFSSSDTIASWASIYSFKEIEEGKEVAEHEKK